jgi:HAD superfamily hydrolase (TIGR01509 family)
MVPNGLRAFLFDLDGTLHFSRPSGFQAFVEYGRGLGLTFTPEAVRQTERWQHRFWADRASLTQLFAEFGQREAWREIGRRQLVMLGAPEPCDDYVLAIHNRFDLEYKPDAVTPPEVPQTLMALRNQGYVVGLVSNRDEPLGPAAESYGLSGLFDFTLSAGEAGSWKPDAAIFHRALQMAGAPASATAYVGDNYYADVVGSHGAGLLPILYDPTGLFPEASCRVIRSIADLLEP